MDGRHVAFLPLEPNQIYDKQLKLKKKWKMVKLRACIY